MEEFDLQKQIEFYFSDANIRHDRFIGQEIKRKNCRGFMKIAKLTNFNLLAQHGVTVADIAEVVEKSSLLELNKDRTKLRRLTPPKPKDNVDECTIYVEPLRKDATHASVRSMFEKYGTVEYVSMPRNKDTKEIKGFAFIEFDSPESVGKCCADYPTEQSLETVSAVASKSWKGPKLLSFLDDNKPAPETIDGNDEETRLCVLSKLAWLECKHEYKRLQRQVIWQLKSTNPNPEGEAPKEKKGKDQQPPKSRPSVNESSHQVQKQSGINEWETQLGTLVNLRGIPDKTTKGKLRTRLQEIAPVAYLDFQSGATVAVVRLNTPEDGERLAKALSVESEELEGSIMSAVEHEAYTTKLQCRKERKKNGAQYPTSVSKPPAQHVQQQPQQQETGSERRKRKREAKPKAKVTKFEDSDGEEDKNTPVSPDANKRTKT